MAQQGDDTATLEDVTCPTTRDGAGWDQSGIRGVRQGDVIDGRYKLGVLIGRGGMGTVYAGRVLATGALCAVKVLPLQALRERLGDAPTAQLYARVLREHAAATRAAHVHAAGALDVGVDPATGDGYLVYELVEGPSLREEIDRRGPYAPRDAADVLVPVLRALAAGHRTGVVHRDVKPDNVLLASDGAGGCRSVLIDWSIAHLDDTVDDPRLTAAGQVLGTPRYMAPELVRDACRVSPAVDVWGAGVVLYEMLTGAVPFTSHSPLATLCRVATERASRVDTLVPVPRAVADVVARALDPDPSRRYPTADAFADALEDATATPTRIVRVRTTRPMPTAVLVALVAVLFAVGCAIGTWVARSSDAARRHGGAGAPRVVAVPDDLGVCPRPCPPVDAGTVIAKEPSASWLKVPRS